MVPHVASRVLNFVLRGSTRGFPSPQFLLAVPISAVQGSGFPAERMCHYAEEAPVQHLVMTLIARTVNSWGTGAI